MAIHIRIFETDPDARPQPRPASDIVGRFRSGRQEGGVPISLDTWRVTTGDPQVAETVARLLGGTVEEWDTRGEDSLEVVTEQASVTVLLDGPDALDTDLKLWGMGGKIIHHCDGVYFLDEDRRGQRCMCPELLSERKALAREGRGPKPDNRIRFRLQDAPDLGVFRMSSGSWDLQSMMHEYYNALESIGGPASATLTLETVSYVVKRGPRAGMTVSYKRPALSHIRRSNAAADEADETDVPF